MGDHLASSLKQVTARAWGVCVLAKPRTSASKRSTSDVDIGPRWSDSNNGPRKLGPRNSMS